jgi:hypothetical protein
MLLEMITVTFEALKSRSMASYIKISIFIITLIRAIMLSNWRIRGINDGYIPLKL